jgi:hypothetical protein
MENVQNEINVTKAEIQAIKDAYKGNFITLT